MDTDLHSGGPRPADDAAGLWRGRELPELASIVARDRRDALAWVHRRFAPVVHGLLLASVERSEVDDLLQECFLRVQRGFGELEDLAALPAWIATIARNLARDHLRRRGREPRREPLDEVHEPEAPAGKPDENGLRERVLARLRELPEAYRETLALRLIEGLSGPEIAERTGLQAASVRVNLSRGMAQLRPLLERDGVLE